MSAHAKSMRWNCNCRRSRITSHIRTAQTSIPAITRKYPTSLDCRLLGKLTSGLRAAAWYQLGGKIGTGSGGGLGLWLAVRTRTGVTTAATLGLACVGCIMALSFLDEPERNLSRRALIRLKETGLWQMLKSRDGLLVAALALSPIGISGVDDFWVYHRERRGASTRTVVLVTGFASAAIANGI